MTMTLETLGQSVRNLKVYLHHIAHWAQWTGDSSAMPGQYMHVYEQVFADPDMLNSDSARVALMQSLYDDPINKLNYAHEPKKLCDYVHTPVARAPDTNRARFIPSQFDPNQVREVKQDMCKILLQAAGENGPSIEDVLDMMKICMIPQKNAAGEVEAVYMPKILKQELLKLAKAQPEKFKQSVARYKDGTMEEPNCLGVDAWVPEELFTEIEAQAFGYELEPLPVLSAEPEVMEISVPDVEMVAEIAVEDNDGASVVFDFDDVTVVPYLCHQTDEPIHTASQYWAVASADILDEADDADVDVTLLYDGVAGNILPGTKHFSTGVGRDLEKFQNIALCPDFT